MLSHRLRHRIHFMEKTEEVDSEGAHSHVWTTVYLDSDTPLDNVAAEVLTGAGREFLAAQAEQAEVDARINLRWLPGITEEMRVAWTPEVGLTHYFDITSISYDVTARKEMYLVCKAGVNDGE